MISLQNYLVNSTNSLSDVLFHEDNGGESKVWNDIENRILGPQTYELNEYDLLTYVLSFS